MPTCSVSECCANDPVPEDLVLMDRQCAAARQADAALGREADVDTAVEPGVRGEEGPGGGAGLFWRGDPNPWHQDPKDESEYTYVNLLRNPERFTGYRGEHPHRIWGRIYRLTCLTGDAGSGDAPGCGGDSGLLYKLVSGMHASITSHIARDYLVDEWGGEWGENPDVFMDRLARPERRDRIGNLYFAYLFVLRAASKAAPAIRPEMVASGFPEADARTRALLAELFREGGPVGASCPVPFDETGIFAGDGAESRLAAVQGAFREITRVMDCVGCGKCKLWGKLQVLGMATALKVNFHQGQGEDVALDRNEVVALVNFLARLSSSLDTVRYFSARVLDTERRGAWADVPRTHTWDPVTGDVGGEAGGRFGLDGLLGGGLGGGGGGFGGGGF